MPPRSPRNDSMENPNKGELKVKISMEKAPKLPSSLWDSMENPNKGELKVYILSMGSSEERVLPCDSMENPNKGELKVKRRFKTIL
jgi:hypothetical protein